LAIEYLPTFARNGVIRDRFVMPDQVPRMPTLAKEPGRENAEAASADRVSMPGTHNQPISCGCTFFSTKR
jgi:hypothetical protein